MTLYNFGANPREEYMLLKLFQVFFVRHFLTLIVSKRKKISGGNFHLEFLVLSRL